MLFLSLTCMSPSPEPCLRNASCLVWRCIYVCFYLVLFHYDHSSLYGLNFAFCIHCTALSCLRHVSVPLWWGLCAASFCLWSCSLLSILRICLLSPTQSFLYWLCGLKSHSRVTCETCGNFLFGGVPYGVCSVFLYACQPFLPLFLPSSLLSCVCLMWGFSLNVVLLSHIPCPPLSCGSCRACTHLIVIEGG